MSDADTEMGSISQEAVDAAAAAARAESNSGCFAAVGALNSASQFNNKLISTMVGDIIELESKRHENTIVDMKGFVALHKHMIPAPTTKTLKYSMWLMMEFNDFEQASLVVSELHDRNTCVIVGICK